MTTLLRHVVVNHDGPPCPVCKKPTEARYVAAVRVSGPVRADPDNLANLKIPVHVEVEGCTFHHDCRPPGAEARPPLLDPTQKGNQP